MVVVVETNILHCKSGGLKMMMRLSTQKCMKLQVHPKVPVIQMSTNTLYSQLGLFKQEMCWVYINQGTDGADIQSFIK